MDYNLFDDDWYNCWEEENEDSIDDQYDELWVDDEDYIWEQI